MLSRNIQTNFLFRNDRLKPHMAPPLVEDPTVSKRVDAMCARGGALHGVV